MDDKDNATPTAEERIKAALHLIYLWGGIDGSQHKQWLIDQVVRSLTQDEAAYQTWVSAYEDGEEGPDTYEWNTGVGP